MAARQPYVQQWATVHPMDMAEHVQRENAQGWAVVAVVVLDQGLLGVLTGPAPSPANARDESS